MIAAGMTEHVFALAIAAGDGALRLFATHDAIRYYELARALPHLHQQLGRAYELVSDFTQAGAIYGELLTIVQQLAAQIAMQRYARAFWWRKRLWPVLLVPGSIYMSDRCRFVSPPCQSLR